MKHSTHLHVAALALTTIAAAPRTSSAAMLLDFGGDHVTSDTALSDATEYSFGGTDGTFTVFTNGTLTLKDGSAGAETDDYFTANNKYMVVWKAADASGGGAGMVFDFTSLAGTDTMMLMDSTDPDNSVPLAKVVVQVDGSYYASKKQKQNDTNKTYSRSDIENETPDFGLVDTTTLAVDTGTSISFTDLDDVTAVGFLVVGSATRAVNRIDFFGDAVVIPEPASLALLGLGSLLVLSGRWRRD